MSVFATGLVSKLNNITNNSTHHVQQVNSYENERKKKIKEMTISALELAGCLPTQSLYRSRFFNKENYPAKCSLSQIAPTPDPVQRLNFIQTLYTGRVDQELLILLRIKQQS
jgi:hypothetical protein